MFLFGLAFFSLSISDLFFVQTYLTGDILYHQVWVWFTNYKPIWNSASSDITSGRVQLDVWRIDEQRFLQSTGLAGRLSNRLVMANQTHTCWYNVSALSASL